MIAHILDESADTYKDKIRTQLQHRRNPPHPPKFNIAAFPADPFKNGTVEAQKRRRGDQVPDRPPSPDQPPVEATREINRAAGPAATARGGGQGGGGRSNRPTEDLATTIATATQTVAGR